MSDNWYEACVLEVEAFLNELSEEGAVVVAAESDIVAAMTGLMASVGITAAIAHQVQVAARYAERLTHLPRSSDQ